MFVCVCVCVYAVVCLCVCVCVCVCVWKIFKKGRGLTGSQFLEEGCGERRGDFFQGVLQFLLKK